MFAIVVFDLVFQY